MSTLTPRSAAQLAASPSIDDFPNLPGHRGPVCVVTGATGFIARHLIALLINKGFRVRGTVRSLKEEADPIKELHAQFPALECFQADLLTPGSFIPALHDAEYVFHLASPLNTQVAHPQSELVDPAVRGTQHLIESALSVETVKKIVVTSSCAAARRPDLDPSHVVSEADWNDAASLDSAPFAYSKVRTERKAWEMVEAHNLHNPDQSVTLIAILPSWVIGPPVSALTEHPNVKLLKSWFDGSALQGGVSDLQVNAVDVRDVAKAHMAAIERPMVHGRYIVSLPDVVTTQDMIDTLKRLYPTRTFPGHAQVRRSSHPSRATPALLSPAVVG